MSRSLHDSNAKRGGVGGRQLDMEDGDEIDAMVHQTGGC
jgi:hypothetical protein